MGFLCVEQAGLELRDLPASAPPHPTPPPPSAGIKGMYHHAWLCILTNSYSSIRVIFFIVFSFLLTSAIFERLRNILHESEIDKRVQYMIEVMFAVRKDGFKDHPVILEGLDLVEEDDQFTHMLPLEDDYNPEDVLSKLRVWEAVVGYQYVNAGNKHLTFFFLRCFQDGS